MFSVLRELYIWFYALNIFKAIAMVFAAILLWSLLGVTLSRWNQMLWRILNGTVFAAVVALIAYITLFRNPTGRHLVLQPFYTIVLALKNREAYRSALMNVILFVPVGLTIPYILPSRWKPARRVLFAVGLALVISTALETLQYCCCVGMTETDDVITNTFGAFVGALQFPIAALFQRCFFKKRSSL